MQQGQFNCHFLSSKVRCVLSPLSLYLSQLKVLLSYYKYDAFEDKIRYSIFERESTLYESTRYVAIASYVLSPLSD